LRLLCVSTRAFIISNVGEFSVNPTFHDLKVLHFYFPQICFFFLLGFLSQSLLEITVSHSHWFSCFIGFLIKSGEFFLTPLYNALKVVQAPYFACFLHSLFLDFSHFFLGLCRSSSPYLLIFLELASIKRSFLRFVKNSINWLMFDINLHLQPGTDEVSACVMVSQWSTKPYMFLLKVPNLILHVRMVGCQCCWNHC
jgi:hypothetical protein